MSNKPEITYVNGVAVSGFLNGVINIAFSTAQFIPQHEPISGEMQVVPAEFISANLRFDLLVAQQLRDALDRILEENTKPTGPAN